MSDSRCMIEAREWTIAGYHSGEMLSLSRLSSHLDFIECISTSLSTGDVGTFNQKLFKSDYRKDGEHLAL